MVQLTKNFSLEEMQCPCGHCNGGTMDAGFMEKLQAMRDACGFPFKIDSAFRCHEHNKEVGGTPESAHLRGHAVDIGCSDFKLRSKILESAHEFGMTGFGLGNDFIHVDDLHPQPVVWTYTSGKTRAAEKLSV